MASVSVAQLTPKQDSTSENQSSLYIYFQILTTQILFLKVFKNGSAAITTENQKRTCGSGPGHRSGTKFKAPADGKYKMIRVRCCHVYRPVALPRVKTGEITNPWQIKPLKRECTVQKEGARRGGGRRRKYQYNLFVLLLSSCQYMCVELYILFCVLPQFGKRPCSIFYMRL